MKKIQILLIGVVAIIGIILAVLFIDPFNWHIRDRFGGDYDAALVAIPADSLAYVGVNMLQYDVDAWDAMGGATDGDGGIVQEIDDAIYAEIGFHLVDEAKVWMGQYAGLAILSLVNDDGGELRDAEWLLVAEVRDEDAAAAFLQKLDAEQPSALVENGRLLLIGSSSNAVEQGMTAIDGNSLANDPDYTEAIAALPAERLLTGYLPADNLPTIAALLPNSLLGATASDLIPAAMGATAVSLNNSSEGVQIDTATLYDKTNMSSDEKAALSAIGQSNAADSLPADTLIYVSGQPIAISWPPVRERLATAIGEADFEESMELFGDDFGLNPDTGLFPLMTGGTAVALLNDMLPVAVLESEEMGMVETAVFQFNDTVTESGLGEIDENNGTYAFSTFLMPDLAFSYALSDDALLFSNDSTALAALPAVDPLSATPNYQEAMAAFTEMEPGLYVNVPALLQASERDVGDFSLVPMIAGGTAVSDNIIHHRLIIFVNENGE